MPNQMLNRAARALQFFLFTAVVIFVSSEQASAQTTEFTYQGTLQNGAAPASGNHDFEFLLFDSVTGGSQLGSTLTRTAVPVTAGAFAIKLDFGSQFPGAGRFLEIHVRQAGGGAFTVLAPRQPITSTPYAIQSLNAANALTASTATTSSQLGGIAASQFVQTADPRLSDARTPTAGSSNYVQNTASPQSASNFNVSGTGRATIFDAATQYNLNGNRVMSSVGTANFFGGLGTGQSNTTGQNNTFVGTSAGNSNITGGSNAFFGDFAGRFSSTGSQNAYFGSNSAFFTSSGSNNAFFGYIAGSNSNGSGNTFIGSGSGTPLSSNFTNATAIGFNAGVNQSNALILGSINGFNGASVDTNVGIGTPNPEQRLHVVGNEILSTGSGAGFKFRDRGATASSADDWVWYSSSNVAHFFRSGTGDVINVKTNGNIGIGTANPNTKLQVVGGSIYIGSPNSLIITSPNGACWFITVNNAGALSTISVTCP